jgi:hypothetical protein
VFVAFVILPVSQDSSDDRDKDNDDVQLRELLLETWQY